MDRICGDRWSGRDGNADVSESGINPFDDTMHGRGLCFSCNHEASAPIRVQVVHDSGDPFASSCHRCRQRTGRCSGNLELRRDFVN